MGAPSNAALSAEDLIAGVREGQRRAIARSITVIENDDPRSLPLIEALHRGGGKAFILGVTGPPGAGKSTLVAALVKELLAEDLKVGVIAVDPTSPFSGGALLGDRVRMDRVANDPRVFIRSMATRGSLGGLSRKTADAVSVLDAAGFDIVIVETVGVGQSEVEIASTADATVVILSPEAGDGIQAMKAGVMEIADIFCVNKSDREGADRLVKEILSAASLSTNTHPEDAAVVVKTVARSGLGVAELWAAIVKHRQALEASGELAAKRRRHAALRVRRIALDLLSRRVMTGQEERLEALAEAVNERDKTPYAAARELIEGALSTEDR